MAGEKRFRTSMFGFNKSDVNLYIEKMLKEFDDRLKEKDDEINNTKNQLREYKTKYDEISRKSDEISIERTKIADVLIKAQEKASMIMDEARAQALEEKKSIELMIEQEKEKLVDIKEDIRMLKSEVVNTLKKYEAQLGEIIDDKINEILDDKTA